MSWREELCEWPRITQAGIGASEPEPWVLGFEHKAQAFDHHHHSVGVL